MNDNYFVNTLQEGLLDWSQRLSQDQTMNSVKCHVAKVVHSASGHSQERIKSACYVQRNHKIKICEKCFLCHSIVLCPTCNKCQKCCTKSACRGQTSKLLANLAESGCRSESCSNPKRGLHPPLSDPVKTHKVSHSYKPLCQSPQEQLPAGGITSAYRQKCSGTSTKPNISGVFQLAIFGSKAQQQVEYFHIPIQEQSRKYLRFHVQGQTYQFKALPFGLSTAPLEFTVVVKEVKLMAIHKGIRIHQHLDD